jgi:anti-sigma regulatory factor (Ser/Thr protein kinase)
LEDLSLHVLDIVENSIVAGAKNIEIKVLADIKKDLLAITIIDDGAGMDKDVLAKVLDPFVTTKQNRRIGLGLPLFAEAAKMAGGNISIKSKKGEGTEITAHFQYKHIDRKPLGDMVETIITLIVGNPEINLRYMYKKNGKNCFLDTKELKAKLGEVPINSLQGIKRIRELLQK